MNVNYISIINGMLVNSLNELRNYFNTGATRSHTYRKEQLIKLKKAILQHEEELYTALYADLKKSKEECWVTELGMTIAELNAISKDLKKWMEPEAVSTNLLNTPSSSYVYKEPLGVVLIIAPWNYPFQLLINPLLGAIAAGNCVVLKPSEFSPATTTVIKKIIEETFSKEYILCVTGDGGKVVPEMMNDFTFDHVFYTGSTAIGKVIYKMAAEKLVPVTLELGGKSPCVVEDDADIKVAAKRIALAKFSNAGQMCVAPDYVLVQHSKKQALVEALKRSIEKFFTSNPAECYNYSKIINEKQFSRIIQYLKDGKIIHGGKHNAAELYIEPALLDEVPLTAAVMQDEIFGPVLPIIGFDTMTEALEIIQQHKNPLALYVFTSSKTKEKQWLQQVPFGGGCINNASWHLTNHHLPFGGRGFSGTGQYHGKASFDTFTHRKAVMKTPTWFDPAVKYPPFKGKLKLFKLVIK
ncbi:MAG: aldehyde dehydrogenase [Ferruginibacter sp.]